MKAIGQADPKNVLEIGKGKEVEKEAFRAETQTVNLGNISDVLQYVESQGTGAQTATSSKKGRRRG